MSVRHMPRAPCCQPDKASQTWEAFALCAQIFNLSYYLRF